MTANLPDQIEREEIDRRISVLRKVDVAAHLGVSTWTIDRWVKESRFPSPIYLQPGSPATWRLRDIEAFLDKARRARRPKRSPRGMIRQRLAAHGGDDAA
jgi:predicted DNA-binding transcriptional regulator AlpA